MPMHRSARLRLAALLVPLAGALLAAGLGACASAPEDSQALTPGELVARGRYLEALELAAAQVADDPSDFEARERHRMVSVAWHLARGRKAFHAGDEQAALQQFEAAYELAPEAPQPQAWLLKLQKKIANDALKRGVAAHRADELEQAAAAFEEVLAIRPEDERASELLALTLLTMNHREGVGEDYYRAGVRSLSDFQLHQADAQLDSAKKYLGSLDHVQRRGEQVDELLVEQRIALAEGFEQEGRWGAARNEYRIALLLLPEHPEAQAGYERTRIEADARRLLDEVDLLTLKGRFEEALKKVEQGAELTQLQTEHFEGARDAVADARLEARYERAIDLSKDFRYEESVALFEELLDEVGYYRDAIARRDTLLSNIEKADQLYARARNEADLEERIALLREIELVWPEYGDVQELLLELDPPGGEPRKNESGTSNAAGNSSDEGSAAQR